MHLKVCDLLLTHNAKVDNKINQGHTPLLLAAEAGFAEVYKLLLDTDVNVRLKKSRNITLIMAVQNGHVEMCKRLHKHDVNVNVKNDQG